MRIAGVASGVALVLLEWRAGMDRAGPLEEWWARTREWLPLIALLVALWPVWRWILMRATSDAGDAWALLSLATAGVLLWRDRACAEIRLARWGVPIVLLLVYAASYRFVPPLVRAVIAMSVVAAACSSVWFRRRMDVRLWGLLLLSLPLVASLNFYLGYPLRVVVGQLTSALLQMNGFAAVRDGTTLLWNGQQISIDAPCSGIKMLWTGLYLSCALAALYYFDARRTVLLGMLAMTIVIAANVLRATALFYVEAGVVPAADAAHSLIGVAVFVCAALSIAAVAMRLRTTAVISVVRSHAKQNSAWLATRVGMVLAVCLLAAVVPLFASPPTLAPAGEFPGWPTYFAGKPLRELPLGAKEQRFAADFPGRVGRFTDGEREIVLRWVSQETRRLHPASDCFRGIGYSITPLPLTIDDDSALWGTFVAARGTERLAVRERIHDAAGNQWTDVSAWYWAATTGKSQGPWWAITIAQH